jgi:hypothetical protein
LPKAIPQWIKQLLAIPSDDNRSSSNPSNTTALDIQLLAHFLPSLQDSSNSFICCNLLAFSQAEASETLPSMDTIQVCSAIIILSIGLSYHRKGALSGNEASLTMAEKMHTMVTKILSDCENTEGVALVAKLAAINNHSLLKHSQGNCNLSQQGFQHLRDPCLRDLIEVAGGNLESSSLCNAQMCVRACFLTFCVLPHPMPRMHLMLPHPALLPLAFFKRMECDLCL